MDRFKSMCFSMHRRLRQNRKLLSLSQLFSICSDPEMIHINSSPEAPPPRIRILDTRAREVETVRIGDRLTFRIEIPEDSKYRVKIAFV